MLVKCKRIRKTFWLHLVIVSALYSHSLEMIGGERPICVCGDSVHHAPQPEERGVLKEKVSTKPIRTPSKVHLDKDTMLVESKRNK